MASVLPAKRQTKVASLAVVWMTPPPGVFGLRCKKSSGSPIIIPSQSMTMVSSSVQAGLEAFEGSRLKAALVFLRLFKESLSIRVVVALSLLGLSFKVP